MYAIIQTGGKQYKVSEGEFVDVEKLDAQAGDKVKFDVVLFADGETVKAGSPILKDIVCEGEVLLQDKTAKILVFKYKPKKRERKTQGHRQPFTRVRITKIG
ncbi:MAG: 50S ribosomal protein L21 [Clostridia bacterium]|jgi:large subunit ribosomal protein L21|nr:50S ribosomal protein L21 [Clostridia bacterium]MDD4275726.1 50S ribosomal protein L21 [Clostridia bacterium]